MRFFEAGLFFFAVFHLLTQLLECFKDFFIFRLSLKEFCYAAFC